MKILMYGWEFPPHISGGLGTACYGLVRSLTATGLIDLAFVMPRFEKGFSSSQEVEQDLRNSLSSEAYMRLNAVKFELVDTFQPISDFTKTCLNSSSDISSQQVHLSKRSSEDAGLSADLEPGIRGAPERFLSGGYEGASIYSHVRNFKRNASVIATKYTDIDFIHAHDWMTFPAAIEAKIKLNKPLIVHVHSTEYDRTSIPNGDIVRLEKQGMACADRIVVVSEYARSIVTKYYDQPVEKVFVLHNAADHLTEPEVRRPRNESSKNVTFIGRITEQKGPEYFVRAAKKVSLNDPEARFVMAGDGDLLSRIKKMVEVFGLSAKFEFPGFLPKDKVADLLSRSSVLVMPSLSEPFGIVAAEAIFSEVPVVLSINSGISELISSAIQVNPVDVAAIADGINYLLSNPSYAEKLAKKARGELNVLSWDVTARKLIELYRFTSVDERLCGAVFAPSVKSGAV